MLWEIGILIVLALIWLFSKKRQAETARTVIIRKMNITRTTRTITVITIPTIRTIRFRTVGMIKAI